MRGLVMSDRRHRELMRQSDEVWKRRFEEQRIEHEYQMERMHKMLDEARIYNVKIRTPRPEGPLLYTVQAVFDSHIVHHLIHGVPHSLDVIAKDVYYRVKHELEMLAKYNRVPE